jgi:hypothetical protein
MIGIGMPMSQRSAPLNMVVSWFRALGLWMQLRRDLLVQAGDLSPHFVFRLENISTLRSRSKVV